MHLRIGQILKATLSSLTFKSAPENSNYRCRSLKTHFSFRPKLHSAHPVPLRGQTPRSFFKGVRQQDPTKQSQLEAASIRPHGAPNQFLPVREDIGVCKTNTDAEKAIVLTTHVRPWCA